MHSEHRREEHGVERSESPQRHRAADHLGDRNGDHHGERPSVPAGGASSPRGGARQLAADDVAGFIRTLRAAEEGACGAYVTALIDRGIDAETIFLELLDSAAIRLGEMWEDDECDFVDVTVALGRLQRILRDLSHQFLADRASPDTVGRVLLSSIPGEHHTLGLFMVAEFFIREGWDVRLGAPLSAAELGSIVRDTKFDVVGFSVASSERLSHVKRTIRQLRRDSQNRDLAVLVGGPVFRDRPTLAAHVGADGTASDARSAPTIARSLISREDTC